MKIWRVILKSLFVCLIVEGISLKATAQATELAQLALNIEKLAQFKSILSQMKDGYTILTKGYNTVKDITQGNFQLHDLFLNNLWKVSPAVASYKRIPEIVNIEITLLQEYKAAIRRNVTSGLFTFKELDYLSKVYQNVYDGTLDRLDELLMYITADKVRMADDERLKGIDAIYADLSNRLNFIRSFNVDNQATILQRVKELTDIKLLKRQAGIDTP